MRNHDGFTLLELVAVIAIMGVLMAIATINFNAWQQKAQIESQTRTLFANLNQARIEAMQHKQPRSVALQAGGRGYLFQDYSSENQSRTAGATAEAQAVNNVITEAAGPADGVTLFDVRGYTGDTGVFQILPAGTSAAVDCVVVNPGQTKMGKYANGTCSIQ